MFPIFFYKKMEVMYSFDTLPNTTPHYNSNNNIRFPFDFDSWCEVEVRTPDSNVFVASEEKPMYRNLSFTI